jgi:hypothetical protein
MKQLTTFYGPISLFQIDLANFGSAAKIVGDLGKTTPDLFFLCHGTKISNKSSQFVSILLAAVLQLQLADS